MEAPLAREEAHLTPDPLEQRTSHAVAGVVVHRVLRAWMEGRSSLKGAVAVQLRALVLGQSANNYNE